MKKIKNSPFGLWLTLFALVISAGILIGDNSVHSQYLQINGEVTASMR